MKDKSASYRWLVLALLFLNLMFAVIAMNCIPPLFAEIGREIPLTKTQMGTVMGVLTLASLFFAPVGGALSDKFGCRWALGGSALLVAGAGSLRFFAGSAGELMACMFLLGVGMAVFGPNIPKALGTWFPPRELAKANGICFASMGVGGALAMATAAGFLSPAFGGWRVTMLVIGGGCLVMAVAWMILFRDRVADPSDAPGEHKVLDSFKKVLGVRDIWLIGFFYGLNMVGLMAIISLLPVVLAEKGVARSGELVSVMMGTTVVFNILGGVVSDKVGRRKPFLIVCAIVIGVCIPCFITFTGIPLIVALVAAGAAMGTIAPVMMAIPVELKPIGTALAGTAVGVIFMIGNTGGFIGPVIAGKLMDMSGSLWPGFIFLAASLVLSAAVIVPLRETGGAGKRGG